MLKENFYNPSVTQPSNIIYDKMWLINALHRPSHLSDFNIFYYCKKGEGGGQKVMIGIIISENVDNYGRPLTLKMSY